MLSRIRSAESDSESNKESTRRRHVLEFSESSNRVFFIVKILNGEPVGYVQLILKHADNDPSLANGKDIAHVHDLLVIPNFRRRGIALQIMNVIEDRAKDLGFNTLTLGVDSPNLPAIELYKRMGYSEFKSTEGQNDNERCLYLHKRIAN